MYFVELAEIVPSKFECSLAEPMEIFGKIKKLFNLGYLETNFSKMPSKISLSVPDGRCDPCCSTEEKGKTR